MLVFFKIPIPVFEAAHPKFWCAYLYCLGTMESKFGKFSLKLSRFVEGVDSILQAQNMGTDCIEAIFIMALD